MQTACNERINKILIYFSANFFSIVRTSWFILLSNGKIARVECKLETIVFLI